MTPRGTNGGRPPGHILTLVRGGGDLATGVALRLYRAGYTVMMTELPEPRAVRRSVAFSECVFRGERVVEGVKAVRVESAAQARRLLSDAARERDNDATALPIPVIVDPEGRALKDLEPPILVDGRMAKRNVGTTIKDAPLVIGLGPGFTAGLDVHAVIETARGHYLGRVIYEGRAIEFTGVPGEVGGYTIERLLKAETAGLLRSRASLGDRVQPGQTVAVIEPLPATHQGLSPEPGAPGSADGPVEVKARISGVLRGLLRDGAPVRPDQKIGDVDPRIDPAAVNFVSDKALAIGGGVLEAIASLLWGRPPAEASLPRRRLNPLAGGRPAPPSMEEHPEDVTDR